MKLKDVSSFVEETIKQAESAHDDFYLDNIKFTLNVEGGEVSFTLLHR